MSVSSFDNMKTITYQAKNLLDCAQKCVHYASTGGYCNDAEGCNLRMQIHLSLDRNTCPLSAIIKQDKFSVDCDGFTI